MKKNILLGSVILTLFSISILIFQVSCSQEAPAQTSTTNCIGAQPKFQYKVNGSQRIWEATFDSRIGWRNVRDANNSGDFVQLPRIYNSSSYPLFRIDLSSGFGLLELKLSSTVAESTYTSSNVGCEFADTQTGNFNASSTHTVNVTRFSGGTADGNFTAIITSGGSTINITEGSFSNIPVLN